MSRPLTGIVDDGVGCQQFERGHLKHDWVEEKLSGRGPQLGVRLKTGSDEVLLLVILQAVDRVVDVLLGHLAG